MLWRFAMRIEKRLRPFLSQEKDVSYHMESPHRVNSEAPILTSRTHIQEPDLQMLSAFPDLLKLRCRIEMKEIDPTRVEMSREMAFFDSTPIQVTGKKVVDEMSVIFCGQGAYFKNNQWNTFVGKNLNDYWTIKPEEGPLLIKKFPCTRERVHVHVRKVKGGYMMTPATEMDARPVFEMGCVVQLRGLLSEFQQYFMTVLYVGNQTTIQHYSFRELWNLGFNLADPSVQSIEKIGKVQLIRSEDIPRQ